MENFVLNLFSDQLSKAILNFNDAKMKINANFMAGKGSITNVQLNVDLINDLLNQPPHGMLPYIQLSEVTLTELRLEVTSYTNLKKAPVVLVIDEIHARAIEPLEYHLDGKAKSPTAGGKAAPQTQYGLLHRIQDNLCVRVNKIELTFRPLGKFKTRRVGPWTPPPVVVTLKDVEWISVTEHGNVGTPEAIWAHNDLSAQQARMRKDAASKTSGHQHRTYTIFKKLSMLGCVSLMDGNRDVTNDAGGQESLPQSSASPISQSTMSSTLISDCNIDMHVAYMRRLRDAAITGVDVDVLVNDADICLDLSPTSEEGMDSSPSLGCSLQSVIHFMLGLQHCMYKDRSFVDPLLPNGVLRTADGGQVQIIKNEPNSIETVDGSNEELGPDDFMPAIDVEDDVLDESSEDEEEPDEEHDEAFLAWKKEQEQGMVTDETPVAEEKAEPETLAGENLTNSESGSSIQKQGSSNSLKDSLQSKIKSDDAPSKYKRKRKAVIVFASGAQKFEKLSFSLTLRRVNAKLFLPRENGSTNRHCFELLAEGIVTECIWPKPSGEIGGNVQCSMRYMHVMESIHKLSGLPDKTLKESAVVRYFPVMRIGSRLFQGYDVFSLSSHWNSMMGGANRDEINEDDEGFPMMEKRQVYWKWSRSNVSGPSAVSLKSIVSFVDEKLALWSKTFVIHEASIGEIEICVDSDPLGRLVKVMSSVPWDDRWFSGDWLGEISSDMVAVPELSLSNHIQPLPVFLGTGSTKLSMLSSDLRNVTARFGGIVVRLPHPVHSFSSAGLADVVCSVTSATVLITSELPRSFLTGTIAVDGTSSKFPNDESDLSCRDNELDLNIGTCAKFRMQVSLADFSFKVVPTQQLSSGSGERDTINNLIAPTKITIMMSLEHSHSSPLQECSGEPAITQSFALSVLIQRLESNLAIQRVVSAASTISHQISRIMQHVSLPSSGALDGPSRNNSQLSSLTDERLSKAICVICLHLPDFELNLFDDRQTRADSNNSEQDSLQLSRLKLAQIEFGLESSNEIAAGLDDGLENTATTYKCSVGGCSLQVTSKDNMLMDILTTGTLEPDAMESNIRFRACHSSLHTAPSTIPVQATTIAAHVASQLMISLDIDCMKFFTDSLASTLSSPIYCYAKDPSGSETYNASSQSTISTLWSLIYDLSTSLGPPYGASIQMSEPGELTTDNAICRLILSNVSIQVPNTRSSNIEARYLFAFEGIEATFGHVGLIGHFSSLLEQQCGGGIQWRSIWSGLESDSFYVIKSTQSLISVDCDSEVVVPPFSVEWDSNKSDVKTRNLIESFLNVSSVMPSIGMKLYFLIPQTSSKSDVPSAARRLHRLVGSYHSKALKLIYSLENKVESMSLSLFAKEMERVGMMSLVTPDVAGWLRVGKGSDLLFHRLFATATLVRYWAVLKNSLLIFYANPGSPSPALIFPLSTTTTSIRTISIPSASNGSIGIAGTHLQQKGFALVDDSDRGAELFCVAASREEFTKWVSALTAQLKSDVPASEVSSDKTGLIQTKVSKDEDVDQTEPTGRMDGTMNQSLPMMFDCMHSQSCTTNSDYLVDNPIANDTVIADALHKSLDQPTEPDITGGVGPTVLATHAVTDDLNNVVKTPSYDQMEEISLDNETDEPESVSSDHNAEHPNVISIQEPQETMPAQETKTTSIPLSRDVLSKKSRYVSAKFTSALKTAKGSVVAASEISRDGFIQSLSNDKNAPTSTGSIVLKAAERSALAGQKLSALKKNANTKMSKIRSSVHQEQASQRAGSIHSTYSSNSRLVSNSESAGLESLGSESDLLELDLSSSDRANHPSRQLQLKKKLTDLDQSMSTTMRRLKIDEKLSNISTAVKYAASESQEGLQRVKVSMSQSKSSHPQTSKYINFDARQTLSSHSDLPVRVKSIKSGSLLKLHDHKFLTDKSKELEGFEGSWFVEVEPVHVVLPEIGETKSLDAPGIGSNEQFEAPQEAQQTPMLSQLNYKITSRCSEKQVCSVEKSLSDILFFYGLIAEMLSTHSQCAAEITYIEATKGVDFIKPIFRRMAPLERITASGNILRGVFNASRRSDVSPSLIHGNCELVKAFLNTVISSSLPYNARVATQDFLGIARSPEVDVVQETADNKKPQSTLASLARKANDSFGRLTQCVNELEKHPKLVRTQPNALTCNCNDSVFSPLLDAMMAEYSNAVRDKDSALASLAAASILKENEVVQKYAEIARNTRDFQHSSYDEEMLLLCQNLGQEIGLRTTAEAEVQSLKQRLELEKKLTKAKERVLLAEVEMYKGLLKSIGGK